jgi:hypothetical protein
VKYFWQMRSNQFEGDFILIAKKSNDILLFPRNRISLRAALLSIMKFGLSCMRLSWLAIAQKREKKINQQVGSVASLKNWRNSDLLSYRHQTTHSLQFSTSLSFWLNLNHSCSRLWKIIIIFSIWWRQEFIENWT